MNNKTPQWVKTLYFLVGALLLPALLIATSVGCAIPYYVSAGVFAFVMFVAGIVLKH